MHIRKLRLFNYKNYEECEVELSPDINCFVGPNGSGKTNLVDAIYYLALTKSAHSSRDSEVVRHGASGFVINSEWEDGGEVYQVNCGFQSGQSKTFKFDGIEYDRLSSHIGRLPLILIAPNDTDVVRGASEIRRKFFDVMLCQADAHYLDTLIKYNHVLKQRNALLKQFGFSADQYLLQGYTAQLVSLGEEIYALRRELVVEFEPDFAGYYEKVAGEGERVEIIFESHATNNLAQAFVESERNDMSAGRTTMGIHRDDYHFMMNERTVKKYGSQGKQKSQVIALKLAQYHFLARRKNNTPLLLLDDIFDKLDIQRIEKLLYILESEGMGQVFITDARIARTRELIAGLEKQVSIFEVNGGKIHEVE